MYPGFELIVVMNLCKLNQHVNTAVKIVQLLQVEEEIKIIEYMEILNFHIGNSFFELIRI